MDCLYGDRFDRTVYVPSSLSLFLSPSFSLSLSVENCSKSMRVQCSRSVDTYLRTGLDSAIGVATPSALIRCCMVGVADVIRMVPCCVKFGPLIIWSGEIASGLYARDTSRPLLLLMLILTRKELFAHIITVAYVHTVIKWNDRTSPATSSVWKRRIDFGCRESVVICLDLFLKVVCFCGNVCFVFQRLQTTF